MHNYLENVIELNKKIVLKKQTSFKILYLINLGKHSNNKYMCTLSLTDNIELTGYPH